MKHILAFLLCTGSLLAGMAQVKNTISGKVMNGETGAPVPGASVFITNTSRGTVSSSTGSFELQNVPEGSYDLIVSSIGFETQVYSYKAEQLPLRLEIHMKPKVEELQAVVVEPDEKNGWEKWGKFFTDNFIGTNEDGRSCRITNYKTLRFRFSKKKNMLHVLADEPLQIENKALGYRVQYQLEDFTFGFSNHVLVYYGYSLFSELNAKGPSKNQFKSREKAWNGSIMHFMRSLYHDSLAAQGFEVRRMVRRPNLEKQRVRILYRELARSGRLNIQSGPMAIGKDSSDYYQRILAQEDVSDEYAKPLLTADSLLFKNDSVVTRRLLFPDYLYIVYRNEKEDPDYLEYSHERRGPWFQRSNAFLPDLMPVSIEPTGNYYPPQSFMTLGYWSWNEKVGDMLPLDYRQ